MYEHVDHHITFMTCCPVFVVQHPCTVLNNRHSKATDCCFSPPEELSVANKPHFPRILLLNPSNYIFKDIPCGYSSSKPVTLFCRVNHLFHLLQAMAFSAPSSSSVKNKTIELPSQSTQAEHRVVDIKYVSNPHGLRPHSTQVAKRHLFIAF